METNKLKIAAANSIIAISQFAGGGALIGLGLDVMNGYEVDDIYWGSSGTQSEILARMKDEVTSNNTKILELSRNNSAIEQKLGKTCIRILNNYSSTGELTGTDTNGVVADLANKDSYPNGPCGDTTTEIRKNLNSWVNRENQIPELQEENRKLLKDIPLLEKERKEDVDFDGWKAGALVGSIILFIKKAQKKDF